VGYSPFPTAIQSDFARLPVGWSYDQPPNDGWDGILDSQVFKIGNLNSCCLNHWADREKRNCTLILQNIVMVRFTRTIHATWFVPRKRSHCCPVSAIPTPPRRRTGAGEVDRMRVSAAETEGGVESCARFSQRTLHSTPPLRHRACSAAGRSVVALPSSAQDTTLPIYSQVRRSALS
jgi:hypothetical protein